MFKEIYLNIIFLSLDRTKKAGRRCPFAGLLVSSSIPGAHFIIPAGKFHSSLNTASSAGTGQGIQFINPVKVML
ncbi:MAG: hypothetical protein MI865_03150 [Proteobacteria bacterium]|nr:hypothetical protein [Pseudomonadota bacterium]